MSDPGYPLNLYRSGKDITPESLPQDNWPSWWKTNPPWEYNDNPDLEDLLRIMFPKERADWDKGGYSLQEREQILRLLQERWRSFRNPTASSETTQTKRELRPDEYPKADVAHTRGWEPGDPIQDSSTLLVDGVEHPDIPPESTPLEQSKGVNDEYPPALVEYVEKENERRRAEERAKTRAMEKAIDNALRRAEDRERSHRETEAWARRLGYKPIDEAPAAPPPPSQGEAFSADRTERDRHKIIGGVLLALVALFGSIAAAYQLAGVINVLVAHVMIFVGWVGFVASVIFIENVLSMPRARIVKVTAVFGGLSLLFAIGADGLMVYLKKEQNVEAHATPTPTPTINVAAATPSLRALDDAKPTPTLAPTPIPQIVRMTPTSSPFVVPYGFTPKPESAQLQVEGGSAQNVLTMLRKQAGYEGPGSVLQFEAEKLSDANERLFFGGSPRTSEKTGFGFMDTRYWATVDLGEPYFFYPTTGNVSVTFVWLKPTQHP